MTYFFFSQTLTAYFSSFQFNSIFNKENSTGVSVRENEKIFLPEFQSGKTKKYFYRSFSPVKKIFLPEFQSSKMKNYFIHLKKYEFNSLNVEYLLIKYKANDFV